jgi:phage-related protein
MADAKIEIKVGAVSFSGEGDGKWLSEQLDKVIEKLPQLANVAPVEPESSGRTGGDAHAHQGKKNVGTLASFLTAKNAKTNKTRKFLATAVWLHDVTGANRLATGDVKKALGQHNQGAVGNASQCLVQNNKQGFTAKDGKQFYVTPEGRAEID